MTVELGDCLEVMARMEANSIDSIVTDPPYGLEFMGKEWDRLGDIGQASHAGFKHTDFKGFTLASYNASSNVKCAECGKWRWDYPERKCVCASPKFPNVKAAQARNMQDWHYAWAVEALRVAKPGAHLLAFGGTRTFHRLACAIEDAGFEIRDCVMWVYGSGFPKSHNVGKAIDKAAGAEREVVNEGKATGVAGSFTAINPSKTGYNSAGFKWGYKDVGTSPWEGWGTALKPAWEPVIVARKPLEGTVAANVLKWGTGAMNIDGCRVGYEVGGDAASNPQQRLGRGCKHGHSSFSFDGSGGYIEKPPSPTGRWPANLIHDGSDEVLAGFPQSSGGAGTHCSNRDESGKCLGHKNAGRSTSGETFHGPESPVAPDSGSAARFFYCAKASKKERDAGCEEMEERTETVRGDGGAQHTKGVLQAKNNHPTVKPVALMRYLIKLVTQPGGTVLDPFMGSGSTGIAAKQEGFNFIGIEKEAEYVEIAKRRIG